MSLGVVKNACAVRTGLPSTSRTISASSYCRESQLKKTNRIFFTLMHHDCDVHIQAGSWVTSVGSEPQYPRGDLQELAAVSVSLFFCKLSSSAQLSARLPILEMLKRGDSQLGHLALSCCFLVSKKLESGVYTKSAIWLKVHESRHLGRHCSTACV